jgi:nitrous oxidase accessory protein NosD
MLTGVKSLAVQRCIGLAVLSILGASSAALAATWCVNPGGKAGCKSTISAAVAVAAPGDTIVVTQGTYKEQVNITKSVSLVGLGFTKPVIDATGLPNGIFINGMAAAPKAGVANVVVNGFKIRNANFEGILVANATNVTLLNNHVLDNNKSLDISTPACPGIPAFETNEAEDCGEGIHLMATDHSNVVRNEIDHNSGGILISDETGPNHDNVISRNSVHDNPYDCGITTASHGPATSVIPSATLPYGIMHNTISENSSVRNGLQLPGAGAGIGIFAPFPGTTAAGNVVIDNDVRDNGLPGITMHNHAWSAMAPPVNLNDNVIVGNHVSGNAADTADAATSGPTGINVFSVAPITGTIISQNNIENESIAVAFNAPMGWLIAHLNNFERRSIGIDNIGAATVDATENWWGCPTGPGTDHCATVVGSGVSWTPWLVFPFENGNHED